MVDASEDYKRSLGRRLREARIRAGKTQAEVATLIGRKKQALSQWEHGIYAPEMKSLVDFAQALDIELSDLLGDVVSEASQNTATKKRIAATASILPVVGIEVAAGHFQGKFDLGETSERYVATLGPHSTQSVAVVVPDRACAPKFVPGDIVTLDPDIQPKPGQFVLAMTAGDEPVLRRWAPGPKKDRLIASNEYFPEETASSVMATMVEHYSTSHE